MKKLFLAIFVSLYLFLFLFLFLFYSPFSIFRDYFITTVMTTKSHQYFAKIFYHDRDILKVISSHKIFEVKDITDLNKIEINSKRKNKLYQKKKIYGYGYTGYLIEVYNPSRVHIVTSSKLGNEGETVLDISRRENAKIVMNAGGFFDPNWSSNGAIPHGTVIRNGKIISRYGISNVGGGFVGLTKEGKLFLGNVTEEEVLRKGVVDAIQFGPFLIINGKTSTVIGNGGWGIAPRSVIGQRKDGTILLLVINGRIPSSIGATMQDLIDIMRREKAYNAVNMDGGSSSSLVVHQKVINYPVGGGKSGLRKLPVFWIVK